MITGELRSKIDKVWEAFWTGGLSNPLLVIEQRTYLLFIRRLDELQTQKEQKSNLLWTWLVFSTGCKYKIRARVLQKLFLRGWRLETTANKQALH